MRIGRPYKEPIGSLILKSQQPTEWLNHIAHQTMVLEWDQGPPDVTAESQRRRENKIAQPELELFWVLSIAEVVYSTLRCAGSKDF